MKAEGRCVVMEKMLGLRIDNILELGRCNVGLIYHPVDVTSPHLFAIGYELFE